MRGRRLSALVAVLGLCGFSAGRPASELLCDRWLPGLERESQLAHEQLAQLGTARGRGLASEGMDRAESRRISKWAESRLDDTQRVLDLLEGENELRETRQELSRVASRWVEFHGYAEQGRVDRMRATLGLIQASTAQARKLGCR